MPDAALRSRFVFFLKDRSPRQERVRFEDQPQLRLIWALEKVIKEKKLTMSHGSGIRTQAWW